LVLALVVVVVAVSGATADNIIKLK